MENNRLPYHYVCTCECLDEVLINLGPFPVSGEEQNKNGASFMYICYNCGKAIPADGKVYKPSKLGKHSVRIIDLVHILKTEKNIDASKWPIWQKRNIAVEIVAERKLQKEAIQEPIEDFSTDDKSPVQYYFDK